MKSFQSQNLAWVVQLASLRETKREPRTKMDHKGASENCNLGQASTNNFSNAFFKKVLKSH